MYTVFIIVAIYVTTFLKVMGNVRTLQERFYGIPISFGIFYFTIPLSFNAAIVNHWLGYVLFSISINLFFFGYFITIFN